MPCWSFSPCPHTHSPIPAAGAGAQHLLISNLYSCLLSPSGHRHPPPPPGQGSGLAQHKAGQQSVPAGMEAGDGKEESLQPMALSRFQLSEEYGFLLPNPLVGHGRALGSAC